MCRLLGWRPWPQLQKHVRDGAEGSITSRSDVILHWNNWSFNRIRDKLHVLGIAVSILQLFLPQLSFKFCVTDHGCLASVLTLCLALFFLFCLPFTLSLSRSLLLCNASVRSRTSPVELEIEENLEMPSTSASVNSLCLVSGLSGFLLLGP